MHHHHHHIPIEQDDALRAKDIYRVTIWGGVVNVLLIIIKFLAGFFGRSSAMIADAVHSFSDFITDVIVLLFVKISNKPADADHAYGHGKYETLATTFVGFILLGVGLMLAYEGAIKIVRVVQGEVLPCPEKVALWAALASIALKEITYQFTARVSRGGAGGFGIGKDLSITAVNGGNFDIVDHNHVTLYSGTDKIPGEMIFGNADEASLARVMQILGSELKKLDVVF